MPYVGKCAITYSARPRLTAKRVERVVSISWASCFIKSLTEMPWNVMGNVIKFLKYRRERDGRSKFAPKNTLNYHPGIIISKKLHLFSMAWYSLFVLKVQSTSTNQPTYRALLFLLPRDAIQSGVDYYRRPLSVCHMCVLSHQTNYWAWYPN